MKRQRVVGPIRKRAGFMGVAHIANMRGLVRGPRCAVNSAEPCGRCWYCLSWPERRPLFGDVHR